MKTITKFLLEETAAGDVVQSDDVVPTKKKRIVRRPKLEEIESLEDKADK